MISFNKILIICILFIKSIQALNSNDPELEQYIQIQENYQICQKNESDIVIDEPNENYCSKTFDGILCWPQTHRNKWAELQCPTWFIGFYNTKGIAKRFCEPNARWKTKKDKLGRDLNITYTDYTDCIKSRETVLYLVILYSFIFF